MTTDEALLRLGESTAKAVGGVLAMFVGAEELQQGAVMVVPHGESPLRQIPVPAVAANVSYVDGVTGGNVFVISLAGAKKLAAAMMGQEPDLERDLSELELSAIGEAMNQMMAAAAAATSATLGQEVEISTPETRFFATPAEAAAAFGEAPHATTVSFALDGETCRLIQLVPNAFVVRMTRALQDLAIDLTGADVETGARGAVSTDALRDVPVRVWAELGRARLPLAVAVGLAPGAVVELDRAADEPVDLYVSGRLFGRGVLVLVEDGEWAVRVQELVPVPQIGNPPEGETH
jgi:flagellar motor switch protein FliN/FliY